MVGSEWGHVKSDRRGFHAWWASGGRFLFFGTPDRKKRVAQPGSGAYDREMGSVGGLQEGEGDRVVGAVVVGEEGAKVAGVDLKSPMAEPTGWEDSRSDLGTAQCHTAAAHSACTAQQV